MQISVKCQYDWRDFVIPTRATNMHSNSCMPCTNHLSPLTYRALMAVGSLVEDPGSLDMWGKGAAAGAWRMAHPYIDEWMLSSAHNGEIVRPEGNSPIPPRLHTVYLIVERGNDAAWGGQWKPRAV